MDDNSCKDEPPGIAADPVNDPERCRCKGATLRAYAGMKDHDAAETEAFDAAFRIYRFHHPEDAPADARLTVERWIYADRPH